MYSTLDRWYTGNMKNIQAKTAVTSKADSAGTIARRDGYESYRLSRPFNYDFGAQTPQLNYECGRTQAILVEKLLGRVPAWPAGTTLTDVLYAIGVSKYVMRDKIFKANNHYFYQGFKR